MSSNRCFDRRMPHKRNDRGGNMKNPTGALALGLITLAGAIGGVAAATGFTSRDAAHPRAGKVVAKVPIPAGTGAFAVGAGGVWSVSDTGPVLTRIDPDRNAVVASIKLKLSNACPAEPPGCGEAAAGDGAVWVTHTTDNTVSRIDPATNRVVSRIRASGQPCGFLAAGRNAVWAAGAHCGDYVTRINPHSNRRVGQVKGNLFAPIGLALGFGSLWIADLDAKT